MLHNWLMLGLVAAGMLFQVALAIDRWVHRQSVDGVRLLREQALLWKQQERLEQMFEEGNRALSRKMGELTRHIGTIELDVVRLKALEEGRHE